MSFNYNDVIQVNAQGIYLGNYNTFDKGNYSCVKILCDGEEHIFDFPTNILTKTPPLNDTPLKHGDTFKISTKAIFVVGFDSLYCVEITCENGGKFNKHVVGFPAKTITPIPTECPACGCAIDKNGDTIEPSHCQECVSHSSTPPCEVCGFHSCDDSC